VLLLERDDMARALLLERIEPGTTLLALDDAQEATAIACALLPRLWRPLEGASGFVTATACAAHWAGDIERAYREHGAPFDVALLRGAVDAFEQLAAYDGPAVSLHQDFHRGNVLRGGREPWLAIDPKPMLGDREYDVRAPLCDRREELFASSDPASLLKRRLDVLFGTLGELDARLSLEWAFVVELTWCTIGLSDPGPDGDSARIQLRSARLLASLLD
jgi:streptomycin 6-kinase